MTGVQTCALPIYARRREEQQARQAAYLEQRSKLDQRMRLDFSTFGRVARNFGVPGGVTGVFQVAFVALGGSATFLLTPAFQLAVSATTRFIQFRPLRAMRRLAHESSDPADRLVYEFDRARTIVAWW